MLKTVEFLQISIKLKIFKTLYEPQTAICQKGIIQPPYRPPPPNKSQIKASYVSETKFLNKDLQEYTDICFRSAPRIQFLGV